MPRIDPGKGLELSSDENRFSTRKHQFKQTTNPDDFRRQREDDEVALRKSEKEAVLAQKRRFHGEVHESSQSSQSSTSASASTAASPENDAQNSGAFSVEADGPGLGLKDDVRELRSQYGFSLVTPLPELAAAIRSDDDPEKLLEAVTMVRRLLSKEEDPPIEAVVEIGLTPRLVELMKRGNDHRLTFEAAWAVTNIASGDEGNTNTVVQCGGIDGLLGILGSTQALRQELCEQAVWGLGNIAGDGPYLRDTLLNKGIMNILQNICTSICDLDWTEEQKEHNLKNVLWVMTNCCRGKPSPPFASVEPALHVFAEVVGRRMKETLVQEALWGLFYCCNSTSCTKEQSREKLTKFLVAGQADQSQLKVERNDLIVCLIDLIRPKPTGQTESPSYTREVRIPALKTLGELVSADDREYTDIVLHSGIFPAILQVLTQIDNGQSGSSANAKKEACWLVSNFMAGCVDQVERASQQYFIPADGSPGSSEGSEDFDRSTGEQGTMMNIFDALEHVAVNLSSKGKYEILREIVFCFGNFFNSGVWVKLKDENPAKLRNIVLSFVRLSTEWLGLSNKSADVPLVTNIVDALQKIMTTTEGRLLQRDGSVTDFVTEMYEVGFDDQLDSIIQRLYETSSARTDSAVAHLIRECSQFKETYFADDEDFDFINSDANGLTASNPSAAFGDQAGMAPATNFDFTDDRM